MRFRVPTQYRSTLVYLATVVASQAASLLVLPLVTRFLEPSRYGEYAVALAVANLIAMFGTSWVRNVGFRFYFDAKAAGRTRAFFWSLAAFQAVAILALLGLVTAGFTAMTPVIPLPTLWAAGVMIVTVDFATLTVALLRAEQRTGRFAAAEMTSAAVRVFGTVGGLLIGFRSPEFLFLAAAGAGGVESVVGLLALRPRLQGAFAFDARTLRQIAVRGPSALPFSLGEWLNLLSDRLILNFLSTSAVVGVYSAGQTLGNRIVAGLTQAVFMMAWPDVLDAWNEGGVERARRSVRRYIQIYLMLTVGPTVALALYARPLAALLGASYEGAVPVVAMIAIATWFSGLASCLNRHYELNKRYAVLSGVTLGGAALNVALTFLLVPRFLGPGSAAATLISQLVVTAVFLVTRDRELVSFPTRDAAMVFAGVVAAGALAWPLFGPSALGLLSFALAYTAFVGTPWLLRMRAARPAEPPSSRQA